MTPEQAAEQLGLTDKFADDLPQMDYADAEQLARSVVLDGERWVVLLRRSVL